MSPSEPVRACARLPPAPIYALSFHFLSKKFPSMAYSGSSPLSPSAPLFFWQNMTLASFFPPLGVFTLCFLWL